MVVFNVSKLPLHITRVLNIYIYIYTFVFGQLNVKPQKQNSFIHVLLGHSSSISKDAEKEGRILHILPIFQHW